MYVCVRAALARPHFWEPRRRPRGQMREFFNHFSSFLHLRPEKGRAAHAVRFNSCLRDRDLCCPRHHCVCESGAEFIAQICLPAASVVTLNMFILTTKNMSHKFHVAGKLLHNGWAAHFISCSGLCSSCFVRNDI